MRILIFTPDSIRQPFGGLGVYLAETLKRFPANYQFVVIGPNTDAAHTTANYVYYPKLRNFKSSWLSILGRFDLIHAMDGSAMMPAIAAKRFLNIPLITHIHLSEEKLIDDLVRHTGELLAADYTAHAQYERDGIANADAVIHVSHAYAARFRHRPGQPVYVVHNGIDASAIRQPVPAVKLPGNAPRKLLYIGRFTGQKGIAELSQVNIPSNIDLYYVGDTKTADPNIAKQIAQHCRYPNVHYLGKQWGSAKIAILQQCDAMIVPSIHEPFGIVALEAIAANCLLLSSFAGGMRDFLSTDFAIPCGTRSETIGVAVAKFATMPQSSIDAMTCAARQILPSFTWEMAVQKLMHIYQQQQTTYHHVPPSHKQKRLFI
jgi:glycosyltransferase involved in cell wall biosynthesis